MPYTVAYDQELDCICVSVTGEMSISLFDNLAAEVRRCISEHGCERVLNDLRQAIPPKAAYDIYTMPKHAVAAGVSPHVVRALVVDGSLSDFRFLETVFVNQGNRVKLFNKMEDAKRWLFE